MTEPTFRSEPTVILQDSMGTEGSIVRAARVSTKGANSRGAEADVGLLKYLLREKHFTPFEHTALTFYIETPIFVSRQIVKSRISSINEVSGRYRELEGEFYVPSEQRPCAQVGKVGDYVFEQGTPEQREATKNCLEGVSEVAWLAYEGLLERGVAKEVARMVLPVNLYTQLYVTMNLRAWLHFVSLRVDWGEDAKTRSHAQYEIEQVALKIAAEIETLFPNVWEAFKASGYSA